MVEIEASSKSVPLCIHERVLQAALPRSLRLHSSILLREQAAQPLGLYPHLVSTARSPFAVFDPGERRLDVPALTFSLLGFERFPLGAEWSCRVGFCKVLGQVLGVEGVVHCEGDRLR
jgi:hypothetical protein